MLDYKTGKEFPFQINVGWHVWHILFISILDYILELRGPVASRATRVDLVLLKWLWYARKTRPLLEVVTRHFTYFVSHQIYKIDSRWKSRIDADGRWWNRGGRRFYVAIHLQNCHSQTTTTTHTHHTNSKLIERAKIEKYSENKKKLVYIRRRQNSFWSLPWPQK